MKNTLENIVALLVFFFLFVLPLALGIWFFQGGDLRDLPKGCYNSQGCDE